MLGKFFVISILFLSISCGVDPLKKTTTEQAQLLTKECSYNSAGPPVCGQNGVQYLNKEQAECFTTVKFVGHCDCSNKTVCGSDGLDYNECDARTNSAITIVKYYPCGAREI